MRVAAGMIRGDSITSGSRRDTLPKRATEVVLSFTLCFGAGIWVQDWASENWRGEA